MTRKEDRATYDKDYKKRYNQTHKKERAKYAKAFREQHPEKVAAQYKTWHDNNKEKRSEYNKEWHQNKKLEEGYEVWITKKRKYLKEYYQNNKEQFKIYSNNRRARIAEAGGSFTKADIRDLYVSQGARCYYCSTNIEEGYEIEHMTPISRGGTNGPENICLACALCNHTKHTKTAEEFLHGGK